MINTVEMARGLGGGTISRGDPASLGSASLPSRQKALEDAQRIAAQTQGGSRVAHTRDTASVAAMYSKEV